jgi:uncharacterized protein (DUF934 family)
MSELIRDGRVQADSFVQLADASDLPRQGDVLVALPVWQTHRAALAAHRAGQGGKVGVAIGPDTDIAVLAGALDELDLIAIEFPKFTDGRGFSLAILLRQRYGFTGELRATGPLLRDQLFYLKRVGFNAFLLRAGQDLQAALASLGDFSVTYQGSADEPRPHFARPQQGLHHA